MLRSTTYRVILTLLALVVGIHTAAAAPLTHQEAMAKIQEKALEEGRTVLEKAADYVVALDTILQATQENGGVKITMPAAALFIIGRDASVAWGGAIELDIAGYLHVRITPDALVARGVIPDPPWWEKPLWGIGGAVGALIITGISGHLK